MNKNAAKQLRRSRRRIGIRKRVEGMPGRPRLSIYKSLNHMYAQVINDLTQTTLASAATTEKELKAAGKTGNVAAAKALGKLLAERAKKAGVSEVVFDRGGFRFHGRVKALADACREGGLKF
jgi:large subunit ribosomal protein L18